MNGQRGVALALVVLACLLLTLAAHALLLLARTEMVITRLDGHRVEADHRLRAALLETAASLDSLPPTGRRTPAPAVSLWIRRPSRELAFLEASSTGAGGRRSGAQLLVLYAPDAGTRARSRGAGLVTPRLRRAPGAHVTPATEVCAAATGTTLSPWTRPPDPALEGLPFPGVGALAESDLAERLPVLPGGHLDVGPVMDAAGNCLAAPANWGDPRRPGGGCAWRYGAGAASGDLVLSGAAQGLLAVDGDLTLERDSHFRGWLLVTGRLYLAPGARLDGVADVALETVLADGARVLPNRCAAAEALEATDALRRPWRLGPPAWPVFPG